MIDVAPVPGAAPDASKVTGTLASAVVGDIVKGGVASVGEPPGGRMTPVGTSRISTSWGFAATKFDPVAVATMVTQLPGSDLHVPNTPLGGLGGAVYTTLATPSALVTSARADSLP